MKNDNSPEGSTEPFSEGWEKLSIDERLEMWWNKHKSQMGNQAERYKTFLENFTVGYDEACLDAYLNFKYDLKLYQYPHPELLLDGFFAVYATSEKMLGTNGAEPEYKLTSYMKVAEYYFASKKEAESEKEHLEAMEGFEPMNMYLIEQVYVDGKKR